MDQSNLGGGRLGGLSSVGLTAAGTSKRTRAHGRIARTLPPALASTVGIGIGPSRVPILAVNDMGTAPPVMSTVDGLGRKQLQEQSSQILSDCGRAWKENGINAHGHRVEKIGAERPVVPPLRKACHRKCWTCIPSASWIHASPNCIGSRKLSGDPSGAPFSFSHHG